MIKVYLKLVLNGIYTCNTDNTERKLVPSDVREAVLEELQKLGKDSDGNEIAQEAI